MAPQAASRWQLLWEFLAQHYGREWPERGARERVQTVGESPSELSRRLDELEARAARRRLRIIEAEGEQVKGHK